jgi:PilZ domain
MENRKYPRVKLRRPILWRGDETLDNFDYARNISEGGLCLAVEKLQLKLGQIIQLETYLPTKAVVSMLASVKWIGPGTMEDLKCRVGLEFLKVGHSTLNEIRHFIGVSRYGFD